MSCFKVGIVSLVAWTIFFCAMFMETAGAAVHEIDAVGLYKSQADDRQEYAEKQALLQARRNAAEKVMALVDSYSASESGLLTSSNIESLCAVFLKFGPASYQQLEDGVIQASVTAEYDDANDDAMRQILENIYLKAQNEQLKRDNAMHSVSNYLYRHQGDIADSGEYDELVEPLQGGREVSFDFSDKAVMLPRRESKIIYSRDIKDKKYSVIMIGYGKKTWQVPGSEARMPVIICQVGLLRPTADGLYDVEVQYYRTYAINLQKKTWGLTGTYELTDYPPGSRGKGPARVVFYPMSEEDWLCIVSKLPKNMVDIMEKGGR